MPDNLHNISKVTLVLHSPGSDEDCLVLDFECPSDSSWLSGGHGFVGLTVPHVEGQSHECALRERDVLLRRFQQSWSNICIQLADLTDDIQSVR